MVNARLLYTGVRPQQKPPSALIGLNLGLIEVGFSCRDPGTVGAVIDGFFIWRLIPALTPDLFTVGL